MRIKGKAASNELARGIPVEGTQPLVPDGRVINEHPTVTSNNGFVGFTSNGHHVNAIHNAASSSNIGGSSLQSHVGHSVIHGFRSFTPALQASSEHYQQVAVTAASDTPFYNSEHPTFGTARSLNSGPFLPVQVTTVDGCVATFVTSNSVSGPSIIAEHTDPSEGTSQFHNDQTSHNVPIILNFSPADMLRTHETASCSYNAGTNQPQTTASTRRRIRACGVRSPANRQPTWTGPPLDYMSFGRCDKVCQHCNALFWVEEKKAGLPMSAAPQYHKCCADVIEGLIYFLNENNALVRLFRTARDKLLEADIPNFQIRLFGVVGASQYELPTADSIGAIVYEGGPESMTDYDIVIERHSREPESVNKLHPSYMSLQFPLLFIYGEEGYHLNLTLRNLAGSDTQEERKMTMKVYYAYQLYDRVGALY
ncbi:hypothetical protein CTI12_AA105050 [Artemisia annua]|uniref:Helitron helicase-like domain-containing protein n=1 Tax=Artemisia annua TaxID=35608 RepID=A0A2U1PW96_ARTAN|nr:hypothetical protein CTI12_AA105050 [Artemisia annua]